MSARNFGEADKLVTFFSKDLGKIRAVAYGCRRPRSPLAGCMQVFSHLRLQVAEGRQLDTVRQAEIKRPFRELRENLDYMAYGAFLLEFAGEICPERHPEPQVFEILLAAANMFSKRNPRIVALAASFQLLECTGCQPAYFYCGVCRRELAGDAFFSHEAGGAVCAACASGKGERYDKEARALIGNLLSLDWQSPASFKVGGKALVETEKLLLLYLSAFLERPLKSLDFIRQLAELAK